jgi:hypothetical protein
MISARNSIIQARVNLLNYSLKYRYSFQRWQNIVNVMIQKDPGTAKIHRLRVIHIYKASYNFLLGLKWRQMLHHGEKNQTIYQGQHGGRPGHQATSLVLMEELKNDIAYASRNSLTNFTTMPLAAMTALCQHWPAYSDEAKAYIGMLSS